MTTSSRPHVSKISARRGLVGPTGMGPVLGRYELLMRVGVGGMATVWAARLRGSRGFQKMVALKTILPHFSTDLHYERLFLDEARLTAQVRHPNVAQILDLGEDNGMLFLAMEWIDGVSVSELLRVAEASGVQIPLWVAVRIATQAAAGLHAAHELTNAGGDLLGLVHRDVSPQNILVSFDGITKVIDFGIAKVLHDGIGDATHSLQVRGKVGYLAPEQIMGKAADRRADVFALGVVIYLLTTGVHPFEGRGPIATLYRISQELVTPPSHYRSDYPKELEAAVLKCLEKNPAQRFATCDELVWVLESSIPSELRATDQDVAFFLRSLANELGAQRRRALALAAVEPAELPLFASPTRSNEVLRDGRPSRRASRRAIRDRPPRERTFLGLTLCLFAFLASTWILVWQWRVDAPLVGPEPPARAFIRSPPVCPPTTATPQTPAKGATPGTFPPRRVSERSQDR